MTVSSGATTHGTSHCCTLHTVCCTALSTAAPPLSHLSSFFNQKGDKMPADHFKIVINNSIGVVPGTVWC